ncbi:trypsin-like peptidase domain-containing protein [Azospirillum sp. B4]|uniref:trypsin-like peptidase domain-containing protein n=1 Tax=Azospirillum sp. B4 TaxID=95605 RepID=UPI0005C99A89|nr:trypsin-like peptidase domain-containing protein [Azospirillum sp. B4]
MHGLTLGVVLCMSTLLLSAGTAAANVIDLATMQKGTVRLLCKADNKLATGSGFLVGDADTRVVVTNLHVLTCGKNPKIGVLIDEAQVIPATVLVADAGKDLALLRLAKAIDRPTVPLADTNKIQVGAPVIAIGFPGAADDVGQSASPIIPSVSRGNISRFVTLGDGGYRYVQHTAPTNPGNSGGPIFDNDGHVIGINSMKALALVARVGGNGEVSTERVPSGEGIALAIDVSELMPLMRAAGVPVDMGAPPYLMIALAAILTLLLMGSGGYAYLAWRRKSSSRATLVAAKNADTAADSGGKSVGRPIIRIVEGPLAGMSVTVEDTPILLGRDPAQASVVFPADDSQVSRKHCSVRFDSESGRFEVRDLGSTNGTFLASPSAASQRLSPNVISRFKPGAVLTLGGDRHRLKLELV